MVMVEVAALILMMDFKKLSMWGIHLSSFTNLGGDDHCGVFPIAVRSITSGAYHSPKYDERATKDSKGRYRHRSQRDM